MRLAASKEELGKAAEAELSEAAVLAAEAALDDEFASREEALEGKVGTPSLTPSLTPTLTPTLTPILTPTLTPTLTLNQGGHHQGLTPTLPQPHPYP